MTILGCIADDFTGASDLAGLLARSGVDVAMRLGVPQDDAITPASIEVIALKCRNAPVDDAIAECLAALTWLKDQGATRFFWKYCSTFDSTAEGNIGPVAEALMAALNVDQTIYCPAFPENGRSIFMGNLFVGEQPLHESPMKDHPLTPMRDSNLMRLLDPQVQKPVGLVNHLTVAKGATAIQHQMTLLKHEGMAHLVVDAVSDDDLVTIADACQMMPLITGGSALAMPLPQLYQDQGLLDGQNTQSELPKTDPSAIILSGSCSAMTRAQVAAAKQDHPSFQLCPLALSQHGLNEAKAWLAAQDQQAVPMIFATADPEDVRHAQDKLGVDAAGQIAGQIIEQAMAELATIAGEMGYRRFVVAGGETSGAVAKALNITSVKIGREIAPGVPWLYAEHQGHNLALALKSGNFGQDSFFNDALMVLETIT